MSPLDRARAWLVTGPLGRGAAFAIDFGVALRVMLARRRHLTPKRVQRFPAP
jgi:hypothetical protein